MFMCSLIFLIANEKDPSKEPVETSDGAGTAKSEKEKEKSASSRKPKSEATGKQNRRGQLRYLYVIFNE